MELLNLYLSEVEEFAVKYRKHILKITNEFLPNMLNDIELNGGECEIHRWLPLFWKTALTRVKNRQSDRTNRLASCYAYDSKATS